MKGWFGDFLLTAGAVLIALVLFKVAEPTVSKWFRKK